MIKQRIIDAGAERRLWKSQFGFRKHCSTEDAIYTARRHIELALARRSGTVKLLALDWKKAFDSVHVGRLLDALRRFGLPIEIRNMVSAMLRHRRFVVNDCSQSSEERFQRSGISQGCTLSPLLFIVVMTVLLHDAVSWLGPEARAAHAQGNLTDLVYADDTLLLAASEDHLDEYLRAVVAAGRHYGMELHWGKFQLMPVNGQCRLLRPDGAHIPSRGEMEYLGSALSADGSSGKEPSRRISMAKARFLEITTVWKHSSLGRRRKLQIYTALVETKLLYSLATLCLNVAERRRLDGFQNQCIRQVLGIKPSFVSRVSNHDVLQQANMSLLPVYWRSVAYSYLETF